MPGRVISAQPPCSYRQQAFKLLYITFSAVTFTGSFVSPLEAVDRKYYGADGSGLSAPASVLIMPSQLLSYKFLRKSSASFALLFRIYGKICIKLLSGGKAVFRSVLR